MNSDDGTDSSDSETSFIDALEDGDLEQAVLILREQKTLSSTEILALADLLDPAYDPMPFDTIYLRIGYRNAGKPKHYWEALRLRRRRIAAIRRNLKIEKKVELAIVAAAHERGESVPTLKKVWREHKGMKILNCGKGNPKKKMTD